MRKLSLFCMLVFFIGCAGPSNPKHDDHVMWNGRECIILDKWYCGYELVCKYRGIAEHVVCANGLIIYR